MMQGPAEETTSGAARRYCRALVTSNLTAGLVLGPSTQDLGGLVPKTHSSNGCWSQNSNNGYWVPYFQYVCFCQFGVVALLIVTALLFGVHIWTPDIGNSQRAKVSE